MRNSLCYKGTGFTLIGLMVILCTSLLFAQGNKTNTPEYAKKGEVTSNWQKILEEDKIFTEDHLRTYLISCFLLGEDRDYPILANNSQSIGIDGSILRQHYGPPQRIIENIDIADFLHPNLKGKVYFYGKVGILADQKNDNLLGLFVPREMKTSYIIFIKKITDEKNIKLQKQ